MLRLTQMRVRLGWSKADLARRAELDQALVSKIEAGRVKPYPVELERLARAMGLVRSRAHRLLEQVEEEGFDED